MATEENTSENTETNESPYEEKALARGWRPKEEFEGDPEEWVDAKTFVEKGELMDIIHTTRRDRKRVEEELNALKGTVGELRDHYEKMAKSEVESKLKELRKERREALRVEDLETADELEDRIDEIRQQKTKLEQQEVEQPAPEQPVLSPEVQQWLNNNPWANENSSGFQQDIASEAYLLLQAEVARTGDRSTRSLDVVKSKMEKLYPERFSSRTRATTSVDSSQTTNGTGKGSVGNLSRRMSEDQRRIGMRFVELGTHKNLEAYAKELKELGEL